MSDEHQGQMEWGGPDEGADIAEAGCILRTVVGSQVHGLMNEGTDDRDEMAVAIEPPEYALGLHGFEHWSHRTQPEGVPSGPGDLDLIVYSLRKYCRLAVKGSPTVLLPLFAPPEHTLITTPLGEELRGHAEHFITIAGKEGFLGYLEAQRRDLLQGRPRRRELSEKHGYDTKYAMHALRVGYQGLEMLRELRITLPMPEPERSRLMAVRRGEVPLNDVLTELDKLIDELDAAPRHGILPPPELSIEQWMIDAYQRHWSDTWTPLELE